MLQLICTSNNKLAMCRKHLAHNCLNYILMIRSRNLEDVPSIRPLLFRSLSNYKILFISPFLMASPALSLSALFVASKAA